MMERLHLVVCPLLLLLLLNVQGCSALTKTRRLVDGTPVGAHGYNYWYLVRIEPSSWGVRLDPPGFQGVLYSERYVLTVASALEPGAGGISVYCGTQVRGVLKVVKHPKFKQASPHPMLQNDIALLEVSPPFQLDSYCSKAFLPKKGHQLSHGQNAIVASYANNYGKQESLKDDLFEVVGSTQCQQQLPSTDALNTTTQLCGRSLYRTGALCSVGVVVCLTGGWRAPFVVRRGIVAGLGSWYLSGCPLSGPAVFTNIASYVDWLQTVTATPAPTLLPDGSGGDPNKPPGLSELSLS